MGTKPYFQKSLHQLEEIVFHSCTKLGFFPFFARVLRNGIPLVMRDKVVWAQSS